MPHDNSSGNRWLGKANDYGWLRMEIEEKTRFWEMEAKRALAVAEDLFSLKRYLEALFFGHLALEKQLKAKTIKVSQQDPIYSHDLALLAKHAKLPLDNDDLDFLARINVYNIRTRYQDYKRSLYQKANRQFTARELKSIRQFFGRIK